MKEQIAVHCAYDEMVDINKLKPHPKNYNTHPQKQIELLAKNIKELGWRHPITVSKLSGYIVSGHARYTAAKYLGVKKVPVNFQDFKDESEEKIVMIADNRIAELAEIDKTALNKLLQEINFEGKDFDLTGYIDPKEIFKEDEEKQEEEEVSEKQKTKEDDFEEQYNPGIQTLKEKIKDIYKQSALQYEVNFWLCLVFESYEQKIEFLKHFEGLETRYNMYIDGVKLAEKIGIKLPESGYVVSKRKPEKAMIDMAMDFENK